jgi:hypothetical protein
MHWNFITIIGPFQGVGGEIEFKNRFNWEEKVAKENFSAANWRAFWEMW